MSHRLRRHVAENWRLR